MVWEDVEARGSTESFVQQSLIVRRKFLASPKLFNLTNSGSLDTNSLLVLPFL